MQNYWWLRMTGYMKRHVDEYDLCQRIKNRTEAPAENLIANNVTEKPQRYLTVDFITKLPLIAGKNVVLVVCDRLSKTAYFVVTIERISVKGLVRLFRDNIWKLHKLPKSVISDKRPQFAVDLTKELNRILEIEKKLLTAFNSQMDRKMECMNQELEQYFGFFVDYKQKNWLEWLAIVKFVVNNQAHLATKISLFIENYNRELRMGVDIRRKEKVKKAMEFVERIKKVQEKARVILKKAQKEIKWQANKKS